MAGRLVTQQFEKAAADMPQKYSASQWAPLFMLVKTGSSTVRQLAAGCALRETTVSAIIDRLERDGYVARQRDATDSRRVNITPTELGLTAVRHAAPHVRSALAQAREVLTDAEQQILFTLLSKFIAAHTQAPILTA